MLKFLQALNFLSTGLPLSGCSMRERQLQQWQISRRRSCPGLPLLAMPGPPGSWWRAAQPRKQQQLMLLTMP